MREVKSGAFTPPELWMITKFIRAYKWRRWEDGIEKGGVLTVDIEVLGLDPWTLRLSDENLLPCIHLLEEFGIPHELFNGPGKRIRERLRMRAEIDPQHPLWAWAFKNL